MLDVVIRINQNTIIDKAILFTPFSYFFTVSLMLIIESQHSPCYANTVNTFNEFALNKHIKQQWDK